MFNNEMMADVHFVVGPAGGTQRVPGHKVNLPKPVTVSGPRLSPALRRVSSVLCQYVLAVGSSVFHAMFYGELAEDQDEIRIPDVEPPSFLAMLKYAVLAASCPAGGVLTPALCFQVHLLRRDRAVR